MKAALYTLGCKVNQYDSQILEQSLSSAGFEIVGHAEKADVYIVNSCTVTAESDRKSRQAIRRFKRQNPGALTVLTGCMPQISKDPDSLSGLADIITGTKNRGRIVEIICGALKHAETGQTGPNSRVSVESFDPVEAFEPAAARGFIGHTRAFVKIEDGCRRFCSYCAIPFARGPVRSKPPENLRKELETLAENGYREAVLVGINLSAYGTDLSTDEKPGLADAVETACAVPGIERVRLGSLEPNLITEPFAQRLSRCQKLCPQFHLSLQSGCGATLERMNRHYTPEEYRVSVEILRRVFPRCAITTDIITGFPGETEQEFAESIAFAAQIGFARAHVFPYSRREGTAAALIKEQVPEHIREKRCLAMIETCAVSRAAFLKAHEGGIFAALFETGHNGSYTGYLPDYTPVRVVSDENLQGSLREIKIVSSDGAQCAGVLL